MKIVKSMPGGLPALIRTIILMMSSVFSLEISFSVYGYTYVSYVSFKPDISNLVSSTQDLAWSRVEEKRKAASHILLTAFLFIDVRSHTAQKSH